MKALAGGLTWIALCALATVSTADNNNPVGLQDGIWIQTCPWDIGSEGTTFSSALSSDVYPVTLYNDAKDYVADLTVSQMVSELKAGYGWWFISTHGNTDRILIEAYKEDVDGFVARENAFDHLVALGFKPDIEIIKAPMEDPTHTPTGYGIAIKAALIKANFTNHESVVHISACKASGLASAFTNHRAFLSYATDVTTGT